MFEFLASLLILFFTFNPAGEEKTVTEAVTQNSISENDNLALKTAEDKKEEIITKIDSETDKLESQEANQPENPKIPEVLDKLEDKKEEIMARSPADRPRISPCKENPELCHPSGIPMPIPSPIEISITPTPSPTPNPTIIPHPSIFPCPPVPCYPSYPQDNGKEVDSDRVITCPDYIRTPEIPCILAD